MNTKHVFPTRWQKQAIVFLFLSDQMNRIWGRGGISVKHGYFQEMFLQNSWQQYHTNLLLELADYGFMKLNIVGKRTRTYSLTERGLSLGLTVWNNALGSLSPNINPGANSQDVGDE